MKKILLLLLFFGLLSGKAQEIRFAKAESLDDYQTILKVSREKEHLLFVALHDGGGDFRKMFDTGVFQDQRVLNALSSFTAVAIDVRDEMGARWVDLFPADTIPSFYFLNAEEFLLKREAGLLTAIQLQQAATESFKKRNRYAQLLEKYNANTLSNEDWVALIELYSLNFPFPETSRLALEFLNSLTTDHLESNLVQPILTTYGLTLESKFPQFIIEHQQQLASNDADFNFKNYFETAYSYNLDLAIVNDDSVLLKKIETQLIPAASQANTDKAELVLAAYKLYAQENERFQYWQNAAVDYSKTLANAKAAEFLFQEGFEIADTYNDSLALTAANQLAQASLKRQNNYEAAMLQSYTSYLLKNYKTSLAEVRNALGISSNEKEMNQATSLMKMIESELK